MAFKAFGTEELDLLREVIDSQELWRGPRGNLVPRFEQAFGEYLGRKYVLAVSTGTVADQTAFASLGLEPGDEVICPATAPIFVSLPVVALGCIPVFAEVDPRTLILSPEGIEACVSPRTRAVVVVHLFGQPAPMDEILAVCRRHGLKVVEDCAQAFDSTYKGRRVGTLGDVACYSLQQSKHITSGEGGIVATDDPDVYRRAVLHATCGMPWYQYGLEAPKAERVAGMPTRGHFAYGSNFRLSELQGAVALAQLRKIGAFAARRQQLVGIIEEELSGAANVELPYVYPGTRPNYWAYPVRFPEAQGNYSEINYLEVVYQQMQRLRRTSVGCPLPDHVRYEPGLCPIAEAAARRFRTVMVPHTAEDEAIRKAARDLRRTADALAAAGRPA